MHHKPHTSTILALELQDERAVRLTLGSDSLVFACLFDIFVEVFLFVFFLVAFGVFCVCFCLFLFFVGGGGCCWFVCI